MGIEVDRKAGSGGDFRFQGQWLESESGLYYFQTRDYDSKTENLRFVTNAENEVTEYQYDANGQQTAVIDALGHKTEYRYNAKGQLVETIYPDGTPNNPSDNPRTIDLYDKGDRY